MRQIAEQLAALIAVVDAEHVRSPQPDLQLTPSAIQPAGLERLG